VSELARSYESKYMNAWIYAHTHKYTHLICYSDTGVDAVSSELLIMNTYVDIYTFMSTRLHTRTHTYTYMHAYTHMHAQTHTHTHTHMFGALI